MSTPSSSRCEGVGFGSRSAFAPFRAGHARSDPRYVPAVLVSHDPATAPSREAPLQSLWREHILASSMLTNRRYDRGQFVLVAPAGGTLDQDRRHTREQDDPIPCCRYAESRKHQPDSSQPDEDGKTEGAIIAAGISSARRLCRYRHKGHASAHPAASTQNS